VAPVSHAATLPRAADRDAVLLSAGRALPHEIHAGLDRALDADGQRLCDYIPPDFYEHVLLLAPFTSRDAFKILSRTACVRPPAHERLQHRNRNDVLAAERIQRYLRPLYMTDDEALRDRGLPALR
jgi:hypothetical protein